MSEFVHLHVHTDFSTLDGACRADRLAQRVKALGMTAVAISDHGTVSGVPAFYKAVSEAGLRPVIGCEVYLAGESRLKKVSESNPTYHMGLVARNSEGYRNLMLLSSDSQRCGFHYKPRTDIETLARHREGLIGFSGCIQGLIPQLILKGRASEAAEATQRFVDIFGKDQFFIEIMQHGISEQLALIAPLRALARQFGLRTVASNDVHYIMQGHADAHDAMLCIQTGARLSDTDRMRYDARQFWLKSPAEMAAVFAEMPDALANTKVVADMCDLKLDFTGRHYPAFRPPEGFATSEQYLEFCCAKGLAALYGVDYYALSGAHLPPAGLGMHVSEPRHADSQAIANRLKHEIGVIAKTGFTDYFLIVADFVAHAKSRGIPVGPGRGSGAGCMVAYALGITAVDPHKYGLLFERFLNPERVSPPDLDIDFAEDRRSEVIDYVRQKYGERCVSGIITFNTLGPKGALRDLCRVHSIPLSDADRLAKLVSEDATDDLQHTFDHNAEFRGVVASSPTFRTIFEQAGILEGLVRNPSKHASGILISDQPLESIVPLARQGDEMLAAFEGEIVSELGLLKMDFLGLKTLTVIRDAEGFIRENPGFEHFDARDIRLDDPETLKLLRSGRTIGVFQFESPGMQTLCRQIQISRFEEISAANALFRPGPMDLIPEYIRGKADPSSVTYMHPLLEPICRETHGIMVYQEQVMQAAQAVAGYSLGQADLLRRAMGKKLPEEMARQRGTFVEGAARVNGIESTAANRIFDVLERFAGYGFNKSHSVAYALLSYRTAYLKAHHPAAFMAALISSEIGSTDKLAKLCQEVRALGMELLGPDINHSSACFTPEGRGVRYGLSGIKTMGESAAQAIVRARDEHGPYSSMDDLVGRLDKREVNRKALEALIKTGALGSVEPSRGRLLASLDRVLAKAADDRDARGSGQGLLFAMPEPAPAFITGPAEIDFHRSAALAAEKDYFGFYLSGHPLEDIVPLVSALASHEPAELQTAHNHTAFRLCGLVSELVVRNAKKDGRPWAAFVLDTPHGGYPIHAYADSYEKNFDLVRGDEPVVMSGRVLRGEDGVRLSMNDMVLLEDLTAAVVLGVETRISGTSVKDFEQRVRALETRSKGETVLSVANADTGSALSAKVKIGLEALRAMFRHPALVPESLEVRVKPYKPETQRLREGVFENPFRREASLV